MSKKERFEILLEEIKSNTRLAFEGISDLQGQVKEVKTEIRSLDKKYEVTTQILAEEIKEVKEIVKKIDHKLDEHIHLPAQA